VDPPASTLTAADEASVIDVRAWSVAFAHRHEPFYWFQRPLHPSFRHCYLFAPVAGGFLLLDPFAGHVDACFLDGAAMARRLHRDHALILTVPVTRSHLLSTVRFRWLPSCVSFAKHFLGFTSWAQTPRQLYRALSRRPDVQRIL
jgi:hypothetical protein